MSNAPIMDRLKEETWPLHQKAEQARLEQDLVKGKLPREVYRDHLGQRYLIHKALEARLRDVRVQEPRVAAVVHDWQFRENDAATDLKYYGGDPATVKALPSTEKLLKSIETADPVAILGHQYVYEGSNNGARFIARALRGAWRLEGKEGTQYLDPYGDQQRERWAEFKGLMEAQEFTPEEGSKIVEAAKAVFLQIIEVEEEVYPDSLQAAAQ